jgi:hypothetical protein
MVILMCVACGKSFPDRVLIYGKERHLHGRKQCLECLPFRPRRSPSFVSPRHAKQKVCHSCGKTFAAKQVIGGKVRFLYRRRFCLECSPFGAHNTSKAPVAILDVAQLGEHRRRKRNAKSYRSQKRRRHRRKTELVASAGGSCIDCGYSVCPAALEFHHRDALMKEFGVGNFGGSLERLQEEVSKCDLLCASCHRLRHAGLDGDALVDRRLVERDRKARAVALMGGVCFTCERSGPYRLFEFHHVDAGAKDFGISEGGIASRSWEKIVAELEKCVMLCANCHREVHAGVRTIRPTLLGLAEDVLPYVA